MDVSDPNTKDKEVRNPNVAFWLQEINTKITNENNNTNREHMLYSALKKASAPVEIAAWVSFSNSNSLCQLICQFKSITMFIILFIIIIPSWWGDSRGTATLESCHFLFIRDRSMVFFNLRKWDNVKLHTSPNKSNSSACQNEVSGIQRHIYVGTSS